MSTLRSKRGALAVAAVLATVLLAFTLRRSDGPAWRIPRWGSVGPVAAGWHLVPFGRLESIPQQGYRLRFNCLTREGARRPRQVAAGITGFRGPSAALRDSSMGAALETTLREAVCREASKDELRRRLEAAGFVVSEIGVFEGGPPPADPELAARLQRLLRPRGRVLFVGLDGADWQFLDPLLAAGRMPNLARILAGGARGTLHSFQPLLSPLIWTTIATGVPPEVHGVLDFFERGPGGQPAMIGSGARQVPALWNILSALDVPVGVVGWWASHPAERVTGVIVSNRVNNSTFPGADTSDLAGAVWPPDWTARVAELRVAMTQVPADRIQALARVSQQEIGRALEPATPPGQPLRMLIQTVALSETTARIAAAAWRELDPNLLMVYFEGTDGIGHLFAPYVSPPVAGAPPAMVERFGDTSAAYYAWLDGLLGDLFALLGPEDTLVLCSDHGFQWGEGRPQTTASGTMDRNAPAWHRLDGMVAIAGAAARSGARGEGSVFDIAPTLLALFGLPKGEGMTGAPLGWALAGSLPGPPPVAYERLVTMERAAPDRPATAEELEQLRALGYIGAAPPARSAPSAEELTGGALNNLGARRLESGDLAGAEDAFRRAIVAEPDYSGAYRNLANVLLRRGRSEEAVAVFVQAFARDMSDAERTAVELALALVERGERGRAVDLLAQLAAKRPQSYTLHVNLGTLLADGGRMREALAAYRRACEIEPGNALAWRNRGLAALRLGSRDEAALAFRRSLELEPDQPELRRMLGPPA